MTQRPPMMFFQKIASTVPHVACLLGTILLVAVLGAPLAHGQSYALRTTHAGAAHGPITGGAFQMQGSIGQPAVRISGDGSPFYLGAGFWYAVRNQNVALPVELSAFTAETDADRVRLIWQTASETHNAGFHVERRIDGSGDVGSSEKSGPFQTIHFADGAGTTTAPQTYRFADTNLPFDAERVTYRLRQVDLDGTATYSEEIAIDRSVPTRLALHALFPNPASGSGVTLRYELPKTADVKILVYDVLGRVVAAPIVRRQEAGRTETRLRLPRLTSGLYFVQLTAGQEIRTQRLTVVR